jgi:hypothetical protein
MGRLRWYNVDKKAYEISYWNKHVVVVFLALQPIVVVFSQSGSGILPTRFRGFLITHNDAPQSVGLLWTSDQSVA